MGAGKSAVGRQLARLLHLDFIDSDGIFNNADSPLEIGEPFRDDNENGTVEPAMDEIFADFNSNQM